jgi:hypothetical protein
METKNLEKLNITPQLANSTTSLPTIPSTPPPDLVADDDWKNLCKEILNDINNDRKEVSEIIDHFNNMVLNEGDGNNATKEALVNLHKIKSDSADKKVKLLDIMSRVKSKDMFPKYLIQHNKVENNGPSMREIIESSRKKKTDDKEKNN